MERSGRKVIVLGDMNAMNGNDGNAPKQIMNVEKLKAVVADDDDIKDRSIIMSVELMRGLRSRANMAADIMSVFGKKHVECFDFVSQKLILVTLMSKEDCPADNLKMIQYRPANSTQQHALYYNLHLLHPIKAMVEGILTGIPHFFSSRQLPMLSEKVVEYLPTLTDVTLEYIPWPGTSIMCGDLLVKATASDLDDSYDSLLKTTVLPLGDFEGQVSFKVTELVDKTENNEFPFEKRDGVSLHNWCD